MSGSSLRNSWWRSSGIGRLPRTVIALSLVSLFNDASSEIIYPLLPVFLTVGLGASTTFVGLIEGIAESTSSLLKLPAGWLSDRIKNRKVILDWGYGLATFIRPLLALTSAGWQVLFLRFTDRVGKGFRSAPRDAMIADAAPADARGIAFGFHRAMDHTGAIAGSLAAAGLTVIFKQDYRSIFLIAAIPGFIGLAVLLFFVREDRTAIPAVSATRTGLSWAEMPPEFKKLMLVLLVFTLSNSSDAFLLLRAKETGIGIEAIPLLWALLHVVKTVTSLWGGTMADRFGKRRVMLAGMLVYAAIYFGFAAARKPEHIWLLFTSYGVYFGFCEGTEKALVADMVQKEIRGTAYGFYNLVIGIAALPASLLMGWAWKSLGAPEALLISACVSLLATGMFLTFSIQHRTSRHEIS